MIPTHELDRNIYLYEHLLNYNELDFVKVELVAQTITTQMQIPDK